MQSILGDSVCSTIIIATVSIITGIILYFKHVFGYWEKRNIPFISPKIPFGNMTPFVFQKRSHGEIMADLYNELKTTGRPYGGVFQFWRPMLLLLDPEMIKLIMTKEFHHFSSRPLHADVKNDPLSGHLLNLNGDEWKFMRSTVSPTFTSGKMKMMFQTIAACSKYLEVIIEEHVKINEPIEVKDTMGRFTTDIIGSCAFGVECNSLKDADSEFRIQGKRLFQLSTLEVLKLAIINNLPKFSSMLGLSRTPKESTEFFMNLVKETVEYREKNNISRKDFMDLLIRLKTVEPAGEDNRVTETGKLTLEQIAAQSFVFFLAGFETSSTSLSSIMYELCMHQDVQDKVRKEINEKLQKYNNELTYDCVMEMKYLEQVIDESMRLHAVAPLLGRKCVLDYKFPDSDFTIEKGTTVFIPVKGFHEDSKYYPNPKVFDPDRFSAEEKAKRHPYVHLPFGSGPRNCIGLRFGMLQMKVGLVALLKNHIFTLNRKTQTPLKQSPKSFLLDYIGGIWIDAKKADN